MADDRTYSGPENVEVLITYSDPDIEAAGLGYAHQGDSGLAVKRGITVLNAPGTIDAGYRGEIKVPLINLDPDETVHFDAGDRIAQLVIQRYAEARFIKAEVLPGSDRAQNGFGSTGVSD